MSKQNDTNLALKLKQRRKINILILEAIFHEGGAEKITYDIVKRSDERSYNFVLCSLYRPGPWGEVFIKEGYRFYRDVIKNKFDLSALYKLKRIIRSNSIDLIYIINQPLTLFWGFVVGKQCKIPIVSVIHNTVVSEGHFKLYIYRLLLPHVDRIVAVAGMQKDHLVRNEHVPEHLIKVIYNGVDEALFSTTVDVENKIRQLALPDAVKIVGIVARLEHLKAVDVFLKAAKLVLQRKGRVRFLVIGDGPELERLKSLSAELMIQGEVYFLGYREDVRELLAILDVAVLSSRTEAFPLSVLEYMASGKAIVATNVGSVPEVIVNGETGLLIEPDDPGRLAENILMLIENSEVAAEIGNRAKMAVAGKFTLKNTVEETEMMIDQLVKK